MKVYYLKRAETHVLTINTLTMAHPKAYSPEDGYQWQILCRYPHYNGKEWEHCDYATDLNDKNHLVTNYRQAYGPGYEFKCILLPRRCWPVSDPADKG